MKKLELILISLLGTSLALSQGKLSKGLIADLNKDGISDTVKVNKTKAGFYDLAIIDGKTNKNAQQFPRFSGYAGLYLGQDSNGKYVIYFTEDKKEDGESVKRGFQINFKGSDYILSFKEFKEKEYPELFK